MTFARTEVLPVRRHSRRRGPSGGGELLLTARYTRRSRLPKIETREEKKKSAPAESRRKQSGRESNECCIPICYNICYVAEEKTLRIRRMQRGQPRQSG